ncbi:MAG: hypothetical protein ACRECF_00390 [Methyloceanibacter sp.]
MSILNDCTIARQNSPPTAAEHGLLATWLREPLVHFTALAMLLFIIHAVAVGDTRDVIHVDASTRVSLVKRKADLLLRPLTPAEESAEIEAFIEHEILWREARHRGLDNNSWFRRQLA